MWKKVMFQSPPIRLSPINSHKLSPIIIIRFYEITKITIFPWFSYGFPMIFLWFSYGFTTHPAFRACGTAITAVTPSFFGRTGANLDGLADRTGKMLKTSENPSKNNINTWHGGFNGTNHRTIMRKCGKLMEIVEQVCVFDWRMFEIPELNGGL